MGVWKGPVKANVDVKADFKFYGTMAVVAMENPFDRIRVVLVGARNPLNIGAAARAMSNFGFMRLCIVNTYDVAFREARSAVGASSVLADAKEFASLEEAVADCSLVVGTTAATRRDLQQPLRRLKEGSALIRKRLRSGNVALLFGSEKIGLTNESMSHCDWLMSIPTRDAHRSMNLAQSVAICLYELARGSGADLQAAKIEGNASATAANVERVVEVLLEAVRESGSLRTRSAGMTAQKIRRMLRRHNLSAADAEFWLGMLRAITWKMKHPDGK
jgi:TrmH family RNA methyltransferase